MRFLEILSSILLIILIAIILGLWIIGGGIYLLRSGYHFWGWAWMIFWAVVFVAYVKCGNE